MTIDNDDEFAKCPDCYGAGKLMQRAIPYRKLAPVFCPVCKGTGRKPKPDKAAK